MELPRDEKLPLFGQRQLRFHGPANEAGDGGTLRVRVARPHFLDRRPAADDEGNGGD